MEKSGDVWKEYYENCEQNSEQDLMNKTLNKIRRFGLGNISLQEEKKPVVQRGLSDKYVWVIMLKYFEQLLPII